MHVAFVTANLRTKTLDLSGLDSSVILMYIWKLSGKFESSNLSRDHLSRETGRNGVRLVSASAQCVSMYVRVVGLPRNSQSANKEQKTPHPTR